MGFGIRRKKTQHESRGRTFEAVSKAGGGVSLKAPVQSSSLGPGALGKGWGGGTWAFGRQQPSLVLTGF